MILILQIRNIFLVFRIKRIKLSIGITRYTITYLLYLIFDSILHLTCFIFQTFWFVNHFHNVFNLLKAIINKFLLVFVWLLKGLNSIH